LNHQRGIIMSLYSLLDNKRKERLKNNKLVLGTYQGLLRLMFSADPIIPQILTIKLYYYISMGITPDFENPRNFNEKLQWLKVYYRDPLYVKCADKYSVREYVKQQGLADILNDLYAVYDNAEDINFDELPNRFAMKCVHGCGSNLICEDKSLIDQDKVRRQFNIWMKKKIGNISGEYHYNYIKPRIIVEKNLSTEDGTLPLDYKFYCFNGTPRCVCVYADRDLITKSTKRCFFDENWQPLNFCTPEYETHANRFQKPDNLKLMFDIARKLSEPFPFVRVDLYEVEGKVIFGELTFTPTGGRGKAYTKACNEEFGSLLVLPKKSKSKNWR
jgi:hypothetical protein